MAKRAVKSKVIKKRAPKKQVNGGHAAMASPVKPVVKRVKKAQGKKKVQKKRAVKKTK